ncbi:MAG: hypothetical protein AB1899_03070 [Pseudomonadota bacterium]
MELAVFKRTVHAAARQAGGRVADIIEPGVTPNFLAARIERGPAPCYVLCSHAGDWAFAEAIEPPLAPLRFTDCPAIADAMHSLFGLTPFTRAEMQAPLGARPGLSESDLRYWKPRTLCDALFNWWD